MYAFWLIAARALSPEAASPLPAGAPAYARHARNPMETDPIHEDVPGEVPLKMCTRGVPVEDAAKRQLQNAVRLPTVLKHIAAMQAQHDLADVAHTLKQVVRVKG